MDRKKIGKKDKVKQLMYNFMVVAVGYGGCGVGLMVYNWFHKLTCESSVLSAVFFMLGFAFLFMVVFIKNAEVSKYYMFKNLDNKGL